LSLFSLPIYNGQRTVIGVAQLINKVTPPSLVPGGVPDYLVEEKSVKHQIWFINIP
jgi:hypothetical protein